MTTMTRKQLYDLIWSKPMRDAASDVGISDVGLKKVCGRHRVPVPPQGHWNKVNAGQKPPKALFREIDDVSLNRVEIAGSSWAPPPEVKKALAEARERERAPEMRIEIPPVAAPRLPAAVRLAAALRKSRTDERTLACAFDPGLFYVHVAPANIDRAVSIVEALLTAAADRGFATAPGQQHLAVVVDGEAIVLGLKETTKRVPYVRTAEDVEREERRRKALGNKNWGLYARLHEPEPRHEFQPTGELRLEVEHKEYLSVARWSDTSTRRLETMLNDVLAGLSTYAAARKERAAEHERRRQLEALTEQRRIEARERAELEKARVEFLGQRLAAFDEMTRLDRFLGRLSGSTHFQTPPPRLQEFVDWAERRVQQLRRQCSAEALQEDLAESTLFGSDPRPPSPRPLWRT